MKKQITTLALTGLMGISTAWAGTVNETNVTTFSAGTAAKAAEVNANFQALITAINDNATRIAGLEDSAPDNSVAGQTYRLHSLNSELAVETSGSFSNISAGSLDATITFDAVSSSGTLTLSNDDYYEVNVPSNTLSNFSDAGGSDTVTFTQTGSTVTVTFPDGGSVEFIVTNDGDMLMGRSIEAPTSTTFDDGSSGTTTYTELLIGVRQ